ncbi:MAG: hypothetical protein AB1650_01475 [Candidatus Omnitrophota bacterium]
MNISLQKSQHSFAYRLFSLLLCFLFLGTIMAPQPVAQAQVMNLPMPGTMIQSTTGFNPPIIKGITIYPNNPLRFDFIVNRGDNDLDNAALQVEGKKLAKYFLAALTVPEKEMWVNLSPYENDRIVPANFGDTEMGRDLLAQDYILKQLTASLIYPEKDLGKEFWDRMRERAQKELGLEEVPTNAFHKIWIVPEKAVIYEHENSAFVIENKLKVLVEEDYLSAKHNPAAPGNMSELERLQTQMIREILIPEITREVNEGKTFANLRQIMQSALLAYWYKKNLRESLLGQIYVDKSKTRGVDTQDKTINRKIYEQYIEAFKKGAYNYIKEDFDPVSKQIIPKEYFSGGTTVDFDGAMLVTPTTPKNAGDLIDSKDARLTVDLVEFKAGDRNLAAISAAEEDARDESMLGDRVIKGADLVLPRPGETPEEYILSLLPEAIFTPRKIASFFSDNILQVNTDIEKLFKSGHVRASEDQTAFIRTKKSSVSGMVFVNGLRNHVYSLKPGEKIDSLEIINRYGAFPGYTETMNHLVQSGYLNLLPEKKSKTHDVYIRTSRISPNIAKDLTELVLSANAGTRFRIQDARGMFPDEDVRATLNSLKESGYLNAFPFGIYVRTSEPATSDSIPAEITADEAMITSSGASADDVLSIIQAFRMDMQLDNAGRTSGGLIKFTLKKLDAVAFKEQKTRAQIEKINALKLLLGIRLSAYLRNTKKIPASFFDNDTGKILFISAADPEMVVDSAQNFFDRAEAGTRAAFLSIGLKNYVYALIPGAVLDSKKMRKEYDFPRYDQTITALAESGFLKLGESGEQHVRTSRPSPYAARNKKPAPRDSAMLAFVQQMDQVARNWSFIKDNLKRGTNLREVNGVMLASADALGRLLNTRSLWAEISPTQSLRLKNQGQVLVTWFNHFNEKIAAHGPAPYFSDNDFEFIEETALKDYQAVRDQIPVPDIDAAMLAVAAEDTAGEELLTRAKKLEADVKQGVNKKTGEEVLQRYQKLDDDLEIYFTQARAEDILAPFIYIGRYAEVKGILTSVKEILSAAGMEVVESTPDSRIARASEPKKPFVKFADENGERLLARAKELAVDVRNAIEERGRLLDRHAALVKEMEKYILKAITGGKYAYTLYHETYINPADTILKEIKETLEGYGGIDLDPSMLDLQIKRDETGIPLPVFQQPIQNFDIDGFIPVIINIMPIINASALIGLEGDSEDRGPGQSAQKNLDRVKRFHLG